MLVYLIAGEPSGDRLGAGLMRALRAQAPGLRFAGVGGPRMAAEGLVSLFPMAELSVMGIAEVLPRLRGILRRIGETAADAVRRGPAALITIDSPEFGLRVAARVRVRAPGIRTIHYVAPSVWAWRPGRARRMARHVDHVLALLPFEPPYMAAAGMGCDFVGHPAAAEPRAAAADVAALRARAGAGEGSPLLLLAPGSRAGVVRQMLPVFAGVAQRCAAAHPGLRVAVLAAEAVAGEVRALAAGMAPEPLMVADSDAAKRAALAAADVALVASGTIAVEAAAQGTAMVSAWRTSALTAAVVRPLLRVRSANLVNLVAGDAVVPEFLQERCTPASIAPAVLELLSDPARRRAQAAAFGPVIQALRGNGAPSGQAAGAVLRVLGGSAPQDPQPIPPPSRGRV